ncbi:MAG: hypothetical protein WAT39_14275 [Planctomycetota bacterium]
MVASFAAPSLSAQRPVFTVGGANPSFGSLPVAVATVPPGSILVVRPGVHTGFTTNKPLRVLLDFDAAGGSIIPAAGAAYAIAIVGLPAGDDFVLVGRGSLVAPGAIGAIRVANGAAPVVIEGVTITSTTTRTGLEIGNVPAAHVRRSVLSGAPGLQVETTNCSLSECVVLGPAGVAAVAYDARLEVVRTFLTGTNQPALRLFGCVARLASDGTTAINVAAPATLPVSPLEAFDCQLQFDPARVGLVPVGTAPALTALNCVVVPEEVPALMASTAPPGQPATVRMTSGVPRPGAIVLGETLLSPLPFGNANIWVNTVTAPLVAAVGICDPLGLAAAVAIPTTPALRGAVFCLQGVVWLPNGAPVLSGPGLWITL